MLDMTILYPEEYSLEKKKTWQKMINIQKSATTGILSVQVFGDTANQVKNVSDGVMDVLINKNSTFLGINQNLKIQVLSGPIVEKNPSFTQIILACLGGFLVDWKINKFFSLIILEFFSRISKLRNFAVGTLKKILQLYNPQRREE
jgi:hypothetical protein